MIQHDDQIPSLGCRLLDSFVTLRANSAVSMDVHLYVYDISKVSPNIQLRH